MGHRIHNEGQVDGNLPVGDRLGKKHFRGGAEIDLANLFSVLRSWTLCRSWMLMDDSGWAVEDVDASVGCDDTTVEVVGRSVAELKRLTLPTES